MYRNYVQIFLYNVQEMNKKLCFFCTMYKNSSEYLYISLVHFVILEILVHFYPISIGLKQTTFWYFSRTRPSPGDYTCNSCDENYWGVNVGAAMNHCVGDEAEDRFSRIPRIPMDLRSAYEVLTISTRVLPWCTFNYYYPGSVLLVVPRTTNFLTVAQKGRFRGRDHQDR